LGVGITTKEGSAVTHATPGSFFWGGAFNTSYLVDRNKRIITLFMFQRVPFDMPRTLSYLERLAFDSFQ
jgi:CubicO group peptidase (beta-lactamase class C family)